MEFTLRLKVILFVVVALVAGALLAGCSEKKREIPQSDWEKLIAIRAEAKAYYSEVTKDEYDADAYGKPSHLEEITGQYQTLFTEKNIHLLERIQDSFQPSPEETKTQFLRLYLIDGFLESAVSQSSDYLQVFRLKEKVVSDGDSVNYLDLADSACH